MQERQSMVVSQPASKNKFVNLLFINSQLRETTFKKTIIFYIVMGVIFLSLSITLFVVMNTVHEQRYQYYTPLDKSKCNTGMNCTINFSLSQSMYAPVYFMYEVGNFYQNHRRYIQSKSNYQLAGNVITEHREAQVCWPYITNQEMQVTTSWGNTTLNPSDIASPCGAIAKTFFNDTFKLYISNSSGTQIAINETGISWPGDQGYKYKAASSSNTTQWINPEDQHFIVWMRTSGLPNFKKLWGRIQSDLQPGNYVIQIANNYNSSDWEGNRFVYLTTKTIFGGKNVLLPCAFLALALGCLVASLFFFKKWQAHKNHLE